jgi:hypothetical protein
MKRVDRRSNDWLDRLPQRTLAGLGLAGLLCLLCAAPARADDHAAIDSTKIIGNRELPKVLYIVPWKKPLPGELSGRPLDSVLDEALAPLDRDVFRRQVHYDAQIEAQAPGAGAGAAPGPK